MQFAKTETIKRLYDISEKISVVDAHTHIQDDIQNFDKALADKNLTGTQASFNSYPEHVIQESLKQNYLVRRLMMDTTHGLFYSWFAQIAEGKSNIIDEAITTLSNNNEACRKNAGKTLYMALQDSRYSEYGEWLRTMFSLYLEDKTVDPLSLENFDLVYDSMKAKRNDKNFASRLLSENNILGYVTSIENRAKIPLNPKGVNVNDVDLSFASHQESFNMFDANYLVWPSGATDFGLFLGGHKYEAEKYLINLENMLNVQIETPADLKNAVKEFLQSILWSPKSNPSSRVRYTDIFHPIDFRLNESYDITKVTHAIRFQKAFLRDDSLKHVIAFVSQAMLEALDDIGREIKDSGEEYGSCLQIALGVTYFMDNSREILSFPVYKSNMPHDAYSLWTAYPNIHFEYIIAHEQLYKDFSNAAKQESNISVGPWWHFFRKHNIANMLYDQLSMGPVSSIASGFTDARFVEMLVAKYKSVRWGVSMALAEMVDDPFSTIYQKDEKAVELMKEILCKNPIKKHHLEFKNVK